MGSSNRKKKEKKKDFQKPKLKVGKAKAKASNFTDTSFKTKGIYHLPFFFPSLHLLTMRNEPPRGCEILMV